jgi:hypothetical protein
MSDIDLTQKEADRLVAIKKKAIIKRGKSIGIPLPGENIAIQVKSFDNKEDFILDFSRGSIKLQKRTNQLRVYKAIVLVRLDLYGSTHRNPDNTEIGDCHLHIYKEGFGDKFAINVPKDKFSNLTDLAQTFEDFLDYCNIEILSIQGSII